jgi:hypothetical protein
LSTKNPMIRTPGAVGLAEKGASLEWHKRTVADAGNGFFPTSSYPFTQRLRLVYLPMADYKEPVSTQPKVRAAMIHPVVSDTHPPFFFRYAGHRPDGRRWQQECPELSDRP